MKSKATFIEPMLLSGSDELPDGPEWLREPKLDGYRAHIGSFPLAFKLRLEMAASQASDSRFPRSNERFAMFPLRGKERP